MALQGPCPPLWCGLHYLVCGSHTTVWWKSPWSTTRRCSRAWDTDGWVQQACPYYLDYSNFSQKTCFYIYLFFPGFFSFFQEFDQRHQVRRQEREAVANMFTQPTANQSWRKVLSMGNLLNGHEPVLREIIFVVRDRMRGSYYAASTPRAFQKEIETYRMYICGTSNDLRVALSVASCD